MTLVGELRKTFLSASCAKGVRRPRGEGRGPRGVRRAEGVPIPPPGAGGPLEEVGGHEEQEEPAGPFDKSVATREPGVTR